MIKKGIKHFIAIETTGLSDSDEILQKVDLIYNADNDEIINMQNSYYNPESTVTVPTKYCHILDIFAKNICHNPSHSIAYKDAEIIVFDDVFADKFIYGAKTSIRSLVKEKYSLNRRKPSLAKCLELTHIDLPLYDCIDKAVALLEIYKSL